MFDGIIFTAAPSGWRLEGGADKCRARPICHRIETGDFILHQGGLLGWAGLGWADLIK